VFKPEMLTLEGTGDVLRQAFTVKAETSSTSLFFERVRKWNGLLIEADPSNYEFLKSKHRKAFTVNACLSTTSVPSEIS
jgi:hypothetical protein